MRLQKFPSALPGRQEFIEGESVRDAPMTIIPKTGAARSLIASADTIYDAIGNKSGAVVLMRDVTALKASEAESGRIKNLYKQRLEDNEAQFRTTFEQAAMGCGHLAILGEWKQLTREHGHWTCAY